MTESMFLELGAVGALAVAVFWGGRIGWAWTVHLIKKSQNGQGYKIQEVERKCDLIAENHLHDIYLRLDRLEMGQKEVRDTLLRKGIL